MLQNHVAGRLDSRKYQKRTRRPGTSSLVLHRVRLQRAVLPGCGEGEPEDAGGVLVDDDWVAAAIEGEALRITQPTQDAARRSAGRDLPEPPIAQRRHPDPPRRINRHIVRRGEATAVGHPPSRRYG